jgi:hypothetical protein
MPGPRVLGGLAVAAVLLVAGALALAHGGHARAAARYGGLPSWLPKATVPVGRVVTADPAHRVYAIQGDTVRVDLSGGAHVMATVVGPQTPEQGRFPVPATSPCTFTVTFAAASGRIALRASDFTILDENGHLHRPRVRLSGGGRMPGLITPERTISLTVYDILPTGEGQLRWAPVRLAGRQLVSWDFDVEID